MMHDEPEPRSTATLRGDTRSLQYYCLRTGWTWELSDKTRSTTEAMQEAWGDELDIVTMLGAEPKSVKRDWRRFEEHRELVDAGRSRKKAREIHAQLESESEREQQLRVAANRKLLDEIEEELNSVVNLNHYRREVFAKNVSEKGPLTLGMEFNGLVEVAYHAKWALKLQGGLIDERDREEGPGSFLKVMRRQADSIRRSLINGEWECDISDMDDAIKAAGTRFGRAWLGNLTGHNGWIRRYRAWVEANDTLKRRKVNDVADKLKMLSRLGKLG